MNIQVLRNVLYHLISEMYVFYLLYRRECSIKQTSYPVFYPRLLVLLDCGQGGGWLFA